MVDGGQLPVLTAFVLGLVVALHPCPLATNIAAMGYVARDVHDKRKVFINGLFYTLGRIFAYSFLGIVIIAILRNGTDALSLGEWFGEWGELILGPLLIVIGLYFILGRFLHKEDHCPNVKSKSLRLSGHAGSFILGVIFALSFCPESAVVYFGMLMPLSAKSSAGYFLPVVFSVATSVPTVILAWGIAYGVSGTSVMKARMSVIQKWMNTIVGIIFVGAGIFCLLH